MDSDVKKGPWVRMGVLGALCLLPLISCTPHFLPRESGRMEDTGETLEVQEDHRIARLFLRINPNLDEGTALLYSRYIHASARRYELDPLLIAAVIVVESRVRATAVSPKGAVGLMQVMPSVGEELAKATNTPWEGWTTLLDPQINIELGCAYLRALLDRYDDLNAALGAYNIGPGLYKEKFLSVSGGKKRDEGPYVSRVRNLQRRWVHDELSERIRQVRMDLKG